MNHHLHISALDAVYAALSKPVSESHAAPGHGSNTSAPSEITLTAPELRPINPQRTPEQREAFIRAEMVKDRERKGYA